MGWNQFFTFVLALRGVATLAKRKLIIDGNPVTEHVPWQVYSGGCGGVVISKDLVLTAAHCSSYFGKGKSLSVGVMDSKKPGPEVQKVKVTKTVQHPKCRGASSVMQGSDFYIAQITPDFDFSDISVVGPAYLAFERPPEGATVNLTGFGKYTKRKISKVLRETTAKVVSNSKLMVGGQSDGSKVIYLLGTTGSACSGDSGGPASLYKCGKPIVIGIASFVSDFSCPKSAPAGYGDVYAELEWIKETWKDLSPETYPPPKVVDDSGNCDGETTTTTSTTAGTDNIPSTTPGTESDPPSSATHTSVWGTIGLAVLGIICLIGVAWGCSRGDSNVRPMPQPRSRMKRPGKRRGKSNTHQRSSNSRRSSNTHRRSSNTHRRSSNTHRRPMNTSRML